MGRNSFFVVYNRSDTEIARMKDDCCFTGNEHAPEVIMFKDRPYVRRETIYLSSSETYETAYTEPNSLLSCSSIFLEDTLFFGKRKE